MRNQLMIALSLTLASEVAAQDMPWVGYTTEGLQDSRPPWKFNWGNTEAEWLKITTDSQRGVWYIQLSSDLALRTQPISNRKFWLKIDLSKVKTERARDSKALWVVDCLTRRFTTQSQTWYLPNGTVEQTRSYPAQDIVPESVAAKISKRVCIKY